MKDTHTHCGKMGSIGCDVKSCVYNDSECKACTAEHIRVENRSVNNKAEAACGTYTPRSGY